MNWGFPRRIVIINSPACADSNRHSPFIYTTSKWAIGNRKSVFWNRKSSCQTCGFEDEELILVVEVVVGGSWVKEWWLDRFAPSVNLERDRVQPSIFPPDFQWFRFGYFDSRSAYFGYKRPKTLHEHHFVGSGWNTRLCVFSVVLETCGNERPLKNRGELARVNTVNQAGSILVLDHRFSSLKSVVEPIL